MDKVKFLKYYTEFGSCYRIDNVSSLENLAFFLSTEVSCFGSVRLTRLINALDEGDTTSGNLITLEKNKANLYLSNVYYDHLEETHEKLKVPMAKLFELMRIWERLMEEEPEEIILIYEKGNFELFGKNFPEKKYSC